MRDRRRRCERSPSRRVIDARQVWPLVEARSRATPDALCAVDESGARLTFGELRARAERVAAALVAARRRTRRARLVAAADLDRVARARGRARAARRGAEPDAADLPRARGRVHHAPGTAEAARGPGVCRGIDHAALAQRVLAATARDGGPPCSLLVCDRALPEADPTALPAFAPARGEPVRWIFYTSGTTADPKGALHTDETIVGGLARGGRALRARPDDRYPIVFPFTHIGGIGMLFVQLISGAGAILVEQYDDETTPPFLGRARRDDRRGRDAARDALPPVPAPPPRGALFPRCARRWAAPHRSRRSCTPR